MRALGIHVFAGGFTRGVVDAGWKVPYQLEVHGFGLETAAAISGTEPLNEERGAQYWPEFRPDDYQMAFGNPRCTAFSTLTSGHDEDSHGPWARQTCDAQEFVGYAAGRFDFLVWESVQQAYTTGRELIDHFVRMLEPLHYRVAHLFLNAASFGNAQQRKRYFFVAYRDCYRFCVEPPKLSPYYPVLYDAAWSMRHRETREHSFREDPWGYDADCWYRPSANDREVMPRIPNGWSQNTLGRHGYAFLTDQDRSVWDARESDMPFSLHCLRRLQWLRPAPTLYSSCHRWIHPWLHRTLTVGEMSAVMGWPKGCIPRGPKPAAQVSKGVVPAVGAWLARQVQLSLEGHWGADDWESSFDDRTGTWTGRDATGQLEKTFDMTRYVGKLFDLGRYDEEAQRRHMFNLDEKTGETLLRWQRVRDDYYQHGGGDDARVRHGGPDVDVGGEAAAVVG